MSFPRNLRYKPSSLPKTILSIVSFFIVFALFFVNLLQVHASTGINQIINFQGKLVKTNNLNVNNGTYSIVFTLYNAETGGGQLWQETQSSVSTTDGVFRVALGSVSSIGGVDFNQDSLWLGIKVGSDPEMTPRIRFTAVPYAFQAKKVQLSGLTNPSGDTALSMGAAVIGFTYNESTGSKNLFNLSDSKNNSGNGYLLNITTAENSSLNPLHISAAGTEALTVDSNGNVGIGETNPGQKLAVNGTIGIIEGGSNATYHTIFQGGDQSLDITYTLPTAQAGGSGYLLANDGAGVLSWISSSGISSKWNAISSPDGNQSLTMGAYTTTWGWDSLTTGTGLTASSSSLSSGTLASLSVNSTGAASNTQKVLNIGSAGSNATSGQTTYGSYTTNTHTGSSSTNIAAYFSASGGTNNYAAIFENGAVGIGTTAPAGLFSVGSSSQFSVTSAGAVTAVGLNSGSGLIQGTGGMTVTGTTQINATGTATTTIGSSSAGAVTLASDANSSFNVTTGSLTLQTTTSGDIALTSAGDVNSTLGGTTNNFNVLTGNLRVGNGTPSITQDGEDAYVEGQLEIDGNSTFGGNVGIGTTNPTTPLAVGSSSQFNVSSGGAVVAVGVNSGLGLLQGTGGFTMTGTTQINATGTGTTTIGSVSAGALTLASDADSSFNVTTGNLTLQTTTSGDIALTSAGNINSTLASTTGNFNVLTGNFRTGNGTPSITQDGEDAYVEGTFEVDGLATFGGNVGIGSTNPGQKLTVDGTFGILEGGSSPSFHTIFQGGDQAGDITYTLPAANVTNGFLTNDGSGGLSWTTTIPATSVKWNNILSPDNNQSLAMAGYISTWAWDSLTSGIGLTASSSSLSSGTLASLSVNSTAAGSNTQKVLNVSTAGANGTSSQTTYGLYSTNTHTGTSSTNVAGYFSASGGSSNYAAIFESGNVGIGTTTPGSLLSVGSTSQFTVSSAGAVVAVGVNSGSGLIQGTGGLTVTGTTQINATGTGTTTIGSASAGAIALASDANSSFNVTTGSLTLQTTTSGDIALTSAGDINSTLGSATNNANILTGNFRVGNGTPSITQDGEDAYVEGQLEIDGNSTFGGNVGIGTTNPITPLAVGSSSQFNVTSAGAVTAVGVNSGSGLIQGTGGETITGTTQINTTGSGTTTIGSSAAGALTLASGASSSLTVTGANLTISTATTGTLALDSAGSLTIGNTNATGITLGRTGITTTNAGALTSTQTLTASNGLTLTTGALNLTATSGSIALTGFGTTSITSTTTTGNINTFADSALAVGAGSTGNLSNFTFTNGSVNTSGTSTTTGINVAATNNAVGSGGTMETYGIRLQDIAGTSGAGTQNNYGIRIGNYGQSNTETSYGLYIDNQTGSTTNYALYSVGGTNYFAGNVGIGSTNPGQKLTVDGTFGILEGGSSPSFHTIFQGGDQSGNITYTLPTADAGGAGYVLTNTSGTLSWTAPGSVATKWNNIASPDGNQSLTMGANTSTWTWDSLTSGTGLTASSSSLSSGSLASLSVNSTAAASNTQKVLNLSTAGTNGTSGQTTYGLYTTNTHTGTSSTNVAGYFSASGGSSNYAAIFENGNVGIGTTAPGSLLSVGSTSQFTVSSAGAVVAVGVNSGSGLIQGTGGMTVTGTTQINATGTATTTIGSASAGAIALASDADSSFNVTTGNLTLQTTTSGDISLTSAANINSTLGSGTGNFNVLTGNLRVGNGTPSITQDGEDAYIEGTFEVDGLSTFGGNVGIGSTNPSNKLDITGNAFISGILGLGDAAIAGQGIRVTSAVNTTNSYGVYSSPAFGSSTTSGYAFNAFPNVGSQNITNAVGYQAAAPFFSTGTTTNAYGFLAANMGSASVTNAYGVYITAQSGASALNYALYSAGGTNYFAGNVGIGTTNPSTAFAVGSSSQFNVSSAGAVTGVGLNSGSGLIQGTGGMTVTGTTQINATGTATTTIGSASAGALTLASDADSSFTVTTGNLTISTATSGTLALDSAGSLTIGNSTATGVTIGRSGITTTNAGALTSTQTLTASNGLTLTTGALNLTGTSGSIALTGFGTTSITSTTATGNINTLADSSFAVAASATGNLSNLTFTNGSVNTSGTSITTGLNIAATNNAAGSGGTMETYGIRLQDLAGTAGAGTQKNYGMMIGNYGRANTEEAYGLYLDAQTGSTTNYSIYAAGGTNYFAGNVGIGSTSPATELDVAGFLQLAGNSGTNAFPSTNASPRLYGTTSTGGAYPFLENGSLVIQPRSSLGRDIVFATGTTPAVRAVIDRNGNVGIGSTSPTAKLQVVNTGNAFKIGDASATDVYGTVAGVDSGASALTAGFGILGTSGNDNAWFGSTTNHDTAIRTNNTVKLTVKAGGNVGIGTTNPGGMFAVGSSSQFNVSSAGAVVAVGVNSGSGLIQGTGGLTVTGTTQINATGSGTTTIGSSAAGAIALASGSASSFTVTGAGLTLQTTTSGDIALTSAANINSTLGSGTGNFNVLTGNLRVGNGTPSITQDGEDAYIEGTFEVDGLSTFGGNVGIGTTTTGARLHLHESTALGTNLADSQILTRISGRTGGNNILQNLWIYRDTAAGTSWTTTRFHDGLGVDTSFLTPGTDTKTWWERDPSDNIQSWGNATSTYMTINAGNVGIGSTTPGGKLHVTNATIGNAAKLVNLVGTLTTSTSSGTGYGLYNSFTNANTSNADTAYANYTTTSDSTALANTVYSSYDTLALSGNAAKIGTGIYSTVSSSSTTADTVYGGYLATSITGAISTGTRNTYGLYSAPANTATNTGGTSNIYGGYFTPSYAAGADVTGSTVNVYGSYIAPTGTLNTGGTINTYGMYIANPTASTTGTSSKVGLYVEDVTANAADTNYAAIFAGGNVGIGTTAPNAKLHVGGGNILLDNGKTLQMVRNTSSAVIDVLGFSSGTDTLQMKLGTSNTTIGLNVLSSGGSSLFTVIGNGNVGIGTSTPGGMFAVGSSSQFNVSSAGAVVGVGMNSGSGLLQGTGGLTLTGTAAINTTGSSATTIGSATSDTTVGGQFIVTQVTDNQSLTSTQTRTLTTKGSMFNLSNDTGTTDSSITVTFDLTGITATDGTVIWAYLNPKKGVTAGSRASCIQLKVNSSSDLITAPGVCTPTQTGASTTAFGIVELLRQNGTWRTLVKNTAATADLAEWIPYAGIKPQPGEIVSVANDNTKVERATKAYDSKVAGIISTHPNTVMGGEGGDDQVILGLSGRVPVKVTTESGAIKPGDFITSSSISGVGMKAVKAGTVVGKALDSFDGEGIGSVTVLMNLTWYDPDVYLTSTGDMTIDGTDHTVKKSDGTVITRMGAFAEAFIGKVTSASITVDDITLSGKKLTETLASVMDDITGIKADIKTIKENNSSGSDASMSAQLYDIQNSVHASITQISADLSDLQIRQNELEAMVNQNVLGASTDASGSSSLLAPDQVATISALTVTGKTNLYDLGVTGTITAGTMVIDGLNSSISTLGVPLQIQPDALFGIEFLGGKIALDKKGNIKLEEGHIEGNETFRGRVIMPSGTKTIRVQKTWDKGPQTINITSTFNSKIWIEGIDATGFTIKVDEAPTQDSELYWVALW